MKQQGELTISVSGMLSADTQMKVGDGVYKSGIQEWDHPYLSGTRNLVSK